MPHFVTLKFLPVLQCILPSPLGPMYACVCVCKPRYAKNLTLNWLHFFVAASGPSSPDPDASDDDDDDDAWPSSFYLLPPGLSGAGAGIFRMPPQRLSLDTCILVSLLGNQTIRTLCVASNTFHWRIENRQATKAINVGIYPQTSNYAWGSNFKGRQAWVLEKLLKKEAK